MSRLSVLKDAMSDVLALLRMRAETVCASEYSAPWSFSFEKPIAHFHIIERGSAVIQLHGGVCMSLEPGDLVFLPLGAGHVLSSERGLPAIPIEPAIRRLPVQEDRIYRLGGGGPRTHLVSGQFSCGGVLARKLLTVLPPLIHLRPEPGQPLQQLGVISQLLVQETRFPRAGSIIVATRLIDLLFIQAIRESAQARPGHAGWPAGLRDPQIGRALSAIHNDPAHPWTVDELAEIAGLSRSAFAAHFTSAVGSTPLRYVTIWRLDLAADHLHASTTRIGDIASQVGYSSEAAFNRAFKAQFGITPAAFRRRASHPGQVAVAEEPRDPLAGSATEG